MNVFCLVGRSGWPGVADIAGGFEGCFVFFELFSLKRYECNSKGGALSLGLRDFDNCWFVEESNS